MSSVMSEASTETSVRADATEEQNGAAPSTQAQLSRAMVRLYKEQFGRGPTKVHSYWCGNDMLTCVLEDSLTPAERNLAQMGEHQRLRDVRMFFQYATSRQFLEVVEEITGRQVRSFVSGIDTEEDVSVETFLLHPAGSEAPSRVEKTEPATAADTG